MKATHTDRQAAFARAKRSLVRQQLVIRLHRWNGPGLQDRIGKIGGLIRRFLVFPAEQTQRALRSSVVTGDRLARTQTFGSTLGLRLRLGDLRKVYVDFLIGDAVEQMPDQV